MATTAATIRARKFFIEAADEFGTRQGADLVIPMRQCELAKRKQVAASTVGAHLSALQSDVVRRTPHIVLRIADTGRSNRTTSPPDQQDLNGALIELCAAQSKVISLMSRTAMDLRDFDRTARGFEALNVSEPVTASQEVEERGEGLDLLLPALELNPERRAADARKAPTASEIDALLQPLCELTSRLGLKAMNNRQGIHRALTGYSIPQIAAAVSNISVAIRTNASNIVSPFGLLSKLAAAGDPALFVERTVERREPTPSSAAEAAFDSKAEQTVRAYEADAELFSQELACLDHRVADCHPYLVERGLGIALRHDMRVSAQQSLSALRGDRSGDEALISTQPMVPMESEIPMGTLIPMEQSL